MKAALKPLDVPAVASSHEVKEVEQKHSHIKAEQRELHNYTIKKKKDRKELEMLTIFAHYFQFSLKSV